jgi:signal transduction histidine kinase
LIGFEHRVICGDGSVRWLQWNSRTMRERGVIFAVGRDVTDRRRADAELREAQRMVEASRDQLTRLGEEQAALRRVATLAARGTRPEQVFAAVADEVGRLLAADVANVCRYEPDGTVTFVASAGDLFPAGSRWPLGERNLATLVLETGRPARLDDYADATGALADDIRGAGVRSAVGTPIIVEGRLWGLIAAGTSQEQALPPDTGARLASFTDLAAAAIANSEARTDVGRLVDEQAALRRVATLVARGVRPDEVFAAVSDEVGRLVGTDSATVMRFDDDGPAVVFVGVASNMSDAYPLGARWEFEDGMASAEVYRTGRSARGGAKDWSTVEGPVGETHHRLGIVSTVASPIVVEGRLWGTMAVQSQEPLPLDTDGRLEKFTELVATAIANAESRAGLARLAEEQAALRRVATLVAHGAPPEEVFTAVANEVGRLLSADMANVCRYESDGMVTFVASASGRFPAGTRWPIGGQRNLASIVLETGRPARLDNYADATGPLAEGIRQGGIRSAVGTPIIVEGRLWGLIAAGSGQQQPLAPDTEARLASFTALVATAIANTEARSEVAASRARIVVATDEERRRMVRDLHDGAQQRLVHTVITLKLAQRSVHDGEQDALVSEALENAEQAMTELRELAHGILPVALTRGGLRAGVDALASRMPVPVAIDVSVGRLPAAVEATAYFVVAEALTNVAKHARAGGAEVTARIEDGTVHVRIRDDGVGGALPDGGGGLIGLADRLAALDGELRVDSPAKSGTLVAAAIPLAG